MAKIMRQRAIRVGDVVRKWGREHALLFGRVVRLNSQTAYVQVDGWAKPFTDSIDQWELIPQAEMPTIKERATLMYPRLAQAMCSGGSRAAIPLLARAMAEAVKDNAK